VTRDYGWRTRGLNEKFVHPPNSFVTKSTLRAILGATKSEGIGDAKILSLYNFE
jgi:hypothetical protein